MNTPTHEDVARCAHQLWQDFGCPSGRDTEIWLQAERQLADTASNNNPNARSESTPCEVTRRVGDSKDAADFARRAKAETAAESVVEYNISPGVSEDVAIKAALQEKNARAPMFPSKTAPKSTPPESGKPLWSKPHSS